MSRKRSLEEEEEEDPPIKDDDDDFSQYQLNIRPDDNYIWLDGKLIVKPNNLSVSYGILLYKQEDSKEDEGDDNSKQRKPIFKYLLGLIPQGNAWTVFKGMPDDDNDESPEETAIREFKEETSIEFPYKELSSSTKSTTLNGRTSKKLLEIYLVEAPPRFDITEFDIDQVVKIDNPKNGYMNGKPEIIHIQFLSKDEATEGIEVTNGGKGKIVKIYKSQIGIIEHAEEFLQATHATSTSTKSKSK